MKRLFVLPYQGGFTASERGRDYMRLLGIPADRIELGYDNISVARLDQAIAHDDAGPLWADRSFICVARFIPKKRHDLLLCAYAAYAAQTERPRGLILCGSGPLEEDTRALAATLGIADRVVFGGWLQTDAIARLVARSVALILPSVEEQFGIAIIEALALGVPVIASESAGARDLFVRSGVNGFVLDGDNHEGLAFFMGLLGSDEARWHDFSAASHAVAAQADVSIFSRSALSLARR